MMTEFELMMKCDMCYDRTSTGRKPMCAAVCPSGALYYGTREEIARLRGRSRPINEFQFGNQKITTKVNMLVPKQQAANYVDITAAMHDRPADALISLNILSDGFAEGVG
jgi:Fe-S-cluster-containing dehydrogenase component